MTFLRRSSHSFFEEEEETHNREVFCLQKTIVSFYVAVEKEYFLGNRIFVEYDEIPDIEEITIGVQIPHSCRNFHEEKKFAMNTTVILEYIVDASDIGNDSNFMEMDNLEEYIFIGSFFGHYLYERRNLIYLFFIERDDFLLSSFYISSEKNNLKKEYHKNYGKNTYDREKDIQIHRWTNKVTSPKLKYIEKRKFWKYFFFLLYFPYTRFIPITK